MAFRLSKKCRYGVPVRSGSVYALIAVNMECGGMFGLYVNKYLKFLKRFDISLHEYV